MKIAVAFTLVGFVTFGCAGSTLAPDIDAARAAQVKVGQTKAQVEQIMRASVRAYSTALRPNELFQAWRFDEGQDSKCLFITYDKAERVTEASILVRERGRNAMPLPSGC